jgi:hypothetical protein
LIDVRIGALRNFPFKPKVHLNYAETVLPMKDGLPKLKDSPGRSAARDRECLSNHADQMSARTRLKFSPRIFPIAALL